MNLQAHNNCNGNDHRWDLTAGVPMRDSPGMAVRMCLDCGFCQMIDHNDNDMVMSQFGLDGRPIVNVISPSTVRVISEIE